MTDRTFPRNTACALICAGVVMLAGCNKAADTQGANPAASGTAPAPAGTSASAQQAPPYTPPTADQLYQMVAPIALFPDKLVAQVLAGSTYPDQITAADNMLQQNPHVSGTALTTMVNPEPWDPSVKGLTQFPSVLDQMAQNIQWTTSLGEAYVNDPTDVMNAIQVMRQRAQSNGTLRSSSQMQVVSQPASSSVSDEVVQGGDAEPVYSGPAVVPAPQQTILLQPAQPDTVYVPQYDPETVYGEPVATYPGYTYVQPAGYSTGQMVAAGAIGFGVGVVVAALLDHHGGGGGPGPNPGWGWNSWGMNWGHHGGEGGYAGGGGWQRPAVVHNNTVYVSRSTTVVNRYVTNNINNSRTVNYVNSNNRSVNNTTNNNQVYNNGNNRYNNTTNNRTVNNSVVNERAAAAGQRPATQQAMTTPHFGTPVRGAEPARFEQARTAAAQPAARPAANEAPRELARPAQQPRPEAAAAREMPRTEPARVAAPRPMERAAQPAQERAVQRPAQPAQERPVERPAAQPVERAPERPAPRPEARPEPERPAARPAPEPHHEAAKPAPKKHDDNQH